VSRALEIVAGMQRRVPFGVALTLDEVRPGVLDVLARLDARATFFLAEVDGVLVRELQAAGHGIGWRTESAHDDLVRIAGRVVRLHRPAAVPRSYLDAVRFRRHRYDSWLWSIDENELDSVRDRDVVRVVDDVERAVALVRSRDLHLVAL